MRKSKYAHANNKGADQPAHSCSLISAFDIHCMDSIILLLSTFLDSNVSLFLSRLDVVIPGRPGNPEYRFVCDEAHINDGGV